MRYSERLILLSCVAASLALASAAYLNAGAGQAAYARGSLGEPTRIATCDVFRVTDALLRVEPYDGLLKVEQEKANVVLQPLDQELQGLQTELQALGAAANEPANREKVQTFQRKREDYFRKRGEMQAAFDTSVSKINFEALLAARQQAKATGEKLGYGLVIATRELDAAKPPDSPAAFSITALSSPLVRIVPEDDITERVIADLGVRDAKQPATTTPSETPAPAKP
ncbi:MAG: hypothetical protein ACKVS8_06505 [Phycisphaerales bacterium]